MASLTPFSTRFSFHVDSVEEDGEGAGWAPQQAPGSPRQQSAGAAIAKHQGPGHKQGKLVSGGPGAGSRRGRCRCFFGGLCESVGGLPPTVPVPPQPVCVLNSSQDNPAHWMSSP